MKAANRPNDPFQSGKHLNPRLNCLILIPPVGSFVAFLLLAEPTPSHALPYQLNCISMQQYANSLTWERVRLNFIGFENQGGFENSGFNTWKYNGGILSCNGYVEQASPLGVKVCAATIEQRAKWVGKNPRQVYAKDILPVDKLYYFSGECRWKK